jgi:hypothetical protein
MYNIKEFKNIISHLIEENINAIRKLINIIIIFLIFIIIILLCRQDLLKLFVFFLWLLITFVIIELKDRFVEFLSIINNKYFLKMSIILFWMNLSCAFFLYDQVFLDLLLKFLDYIDKLLNNNFF